MARYKHIDTSPRFLAVDLQRQLLPDIFEHAMNHLIDKKLDLSSPNLESFAHCLTMPASKTTTRAPPLIRPPRARQPPCIPSFIRALESHLPYRLQHFLSGS